MLLNELSTKCIYVHHVDDLCSKFHVPNSTLYIIIWPKIYLTPLDCSQLDRRSSLAPLSSIKRSFSMQSCLFWFRVMFLWDSLLNMTWFIQIMYLCNTSPNDPTVFKRSAKFNYCTSITSANAAAYLHADCCCILNDFFFWKIVGLSMDFTIKWKCLEMNTPLPQKKKNYYQNTAASVPLFNIGYE